eukprot:PLAT5444.2.p2 GENE.PLAT5444.2~~PLAT5444.2.p2  ORF type:complete len:227 (-),score=76.86 PLAT5444.2:107-787(-)
MAAVHSALGIDFSFINIGGGLGIPYRPEESALCLPDVAATVHSTLTAKTAEHGLSMPDVHMENGRYVTGPSGHLLTRVQAMKTTGRTPFLGMDACMAHLMRPGMYGAYHHITVPAREAAAAAEAAAAEDGKEEAAAVERSEMNVVGTLCENNDWFAKARLLPADTTLGDLLLIHDTGAHGHSMGFQYNGSLRAPEVIVSEDGSSRLIRERETVESYFATSLGLAGL